MVLISKAKSFWGLSRNPWVLTKASVFELHPSPPGSEWQHKSVLWSFTYWSFVLGFMEFSCCVKNLGVIQWLADICLQILRLVSLWFPLLEILAPHIYAVVGLRFGLWLFGLFSSLKLTVTAWSSIPCTANQKMYSEKTQD